jgi:hypothetical protein
MLKVDESKRASIMSPRLSLSLSPATSDLVKEDPAIHGEPITQAQQKEPTMSELIKGVTLFIVCLALYCLQMLIVKIFMQKFHISAFEVTY